MPTVGRRRPGALTTQVRYTPSTRKPDLRKPYLAVELACIAVATGAFLHWIAFRKDPPTATHWMTILMVGTEVAGIIADPWRSHLPAHTNTGPGNTHPRQRTAKVPTKVRRASL